MEAVTVAVRVRPFNDREKNLHAECAVQMEENTTVLTDSKSGEVHRFTFDHSYWSFDQTSPHSASQETVFTDIGAGVLDAAWNGFNSSLFAYGQTGSGKSYSMIGGGSPDSRGIIPRVCEEIFTRLAADSETVSSSVRVSFLEIYREAIRDLLNPKAEASQLTVRQHPSVGVYVDGLTKHLVSSYGEVEQLMAQGFAVRTVAATKMNHTSSRSHCAFMIEFNRTVGEGDSQRTIRSSISLIDLAGSERQANTQATGVRLKEACAINKSLSALGNVISALAHNSKVEEEGSGRKRFVPYRESVLTRLLTDSLGGNAKTIMIAAISPASSNHGETLSTLRYADRAKQIKNKPQRNESKQERRIRELEEEAAALRAQLEAAGGAAPQDASATVAELAEETEMLAAQKQALQARLAQSESIIRDLSSNLAISHEEAQRLAAEREEYLREAGVHTTSLGSSLFGHEGADLPPSLLNISPDAMFNGTVTYHLHSVKEKRSLTTIGAAPDCDITLHTSGLAARHATVTLVRALDDGTPSAFIEPIGDAALLINGTELADIAPTADGYPLAPGDCVFFGNRCFLRYCVGSLPPAEPDDFYRQMTMVQMKRSPAAAAAGPDLLVFDDDADGRSGLLPQILAADRLCEEANSLARELGQDVMYSLNIIRKGEQPRSGTAEGVEVVCTLLDVPAVKFVPVAFLEAHLDELRLKVEDKRHAQFAPAPRDKPDKSGLQLISKGFRKQPALDLSVTKRIIPQPTQVLLGHFAVELGGDAARCPIALVTPDVLGEFAERLQDAWLWCRACKHVAADPPVSGLEIDVHTRVRPVPGVGSMVFVRFGAGNPAVLESWLRRVFDTMISAEGKKQVAPLKTAHKPGKADDIPGRFVLLFGTEGTINRGCRLDESFNFIAEQWGDEGAQPEQLHFFLFYQPIVPTHTVHVHSEDTGTELQIQHLALEAQVLRTENARLREMLADAQ